MSITPDGRDGGRDLPFEVNARLVLVEAGVAGA